MYNRKIAFSMHGVHGENMFCFGVASPMRYWRIRLAFVGLSAALRLPIRPLARAYVLDLWSARIRHAALRAPTPHALQYIAGIAESYRTQSASYRLPCSPSLEYRHLLLEVE